MSIIYFVQIIPKNNVFNPEFYTILKLTSLEIGEHSGFFLILDTSTLNFRQVKITKLSTLILSFEQFKFCNSSKLEPPIV